MRLENVHLHSLFWLHLFTFFCKKKKVVMYYLIYFNLSQTYNFVSLISLASMFWTVEDTRIPQVNPHRHWEYMQTRHRKAPQPPAEPRKKLQLILEAYLK